jgi:hypothetical protein
MKNLFLTLAISSLGLFSNAQTEGPRGPKMDPKIQTDRMAFDLGLNDEQKSKVLSINTDVSTKMQALRKSQTEGTSRQDEIIKIEQEKDSALKGVLTDIQYKKYAQMRADARKQRQSQQTQ